MMLLIKFEGSIASGIEDKICLNVSLYKPMKNICSHLVPFLPPDHSLNRLCRNALGYDTYQLSTI